VTVAVRHSSNQLSAADQYLSAVAATDGSHSFTQISGTIFALLPDAGPLPLLGCTGYRVVAADPVDDGWALRGREVLLFTDLASGAVLNSWRNPINDALVTVLHDWLDPVCSRATSETVPTAQEVGSAHTFRSFVTQASPNPLRPDVFRRENALLTLQRSEHTVLTVLTLPTLEGDTTRLSSVRFTPWLPWMLLAGTSGSLVFHLTGARIDGFDSLPAAVREVVNANRPEFAFAPNTWSDRQENSWSLYLAERQPA
jgi:Protein of unknown function (DUF1838)